MATPGQTGARVEDAFGVKNGISFRATLREGAALPAHF
jgi:hypothetical protein